MSGPLPPRVTIVEVGPRDGLQNESATVSTADKIAFVNALSAAGHRAIEVAAFVSPKWVPQMGDAEAVCAGMTRQPDVSYRALVPNRAGFDRALTAGVREVAIAAAASETFSRKNINQSIDESLAGYKALTGVAEEAGVRVRAYLSTSFGCPYEGSVAVDTVISLTTRLLEMGAYEVAVSDTIGVAHPGQVAALLERLLIEVPLSHVALHFHDTRGTALANVLMALTFGVTTFDSSAGGLGGCPYAPGAAGNLATEDLIYMLEGLGIDSGVSLDAAIAASRTIESVLGESVLGESVLGGPALSESALGRRLPSRFLRAVTSRPA